MKNSLLEALKELLVNALEPHQAQAIIDDKVLIETDDAQVAPIRVGSASAHSFRILNGFEQHRFSQEALWPLLHIEQIGFLSPDMREQLLDELLTSEVEVITHNDVKWALLNLTYNVTSAEQRLFLDFVLSQESQPLH